MAIKIQDNFQLNVALPIDNRIVASGSSARDAIAFKYDGLRVFDTSDRKSYVWNSSGATWSASDTAGTGLVSTLSKWGSTTGLTSSGVYFVSGSGLNVGKVGINTNDPKGALHIVGDGGVAKFVFHSYSTGVIFGQNFYNDGSDQYFDIGNGSSAIRMNTSGHIDFLCRVTGAAALNSTGGDGNTNMMMKIDPAVSRTFLYTDLILSSTRTLPTTSALYLRRSSTFSTESTPDITWWNNDQTGIYHPGNNIIAFSISASQMMRLTSTGLIVGAQTTTSHRISISNASAVGTYLQATNGTMGSGGNRGAFFGINTQGSATILSREGSGLSTKPISLGFASGNISHKFDDTTFSMYGGGVTELESTTQNKTRCVRGYAQWTQTCSAGQDAFVGSFYLPANNAMFSIEITYTTRVFNTGTNHFKVQKQICIGNIDSSGNVFFHSSNSFLANPSILGVDGGVIPNPSTANPSFVLGKELYKMSSSNGESNIGNGMLSVVSTTPKSFEFRVRIKLGTNVTVNTAASYVISIIDY
jgi:hypothetical protein